MMIIEEHEKAYSNSATVWDRRMIAMQYAAYVLSYSYYSTFDRIVAHEGFFSSANYIYNPIGNQSGF
jgi:hypothetical protein